MKSTLHITLVQNAAGEHIGNNLEAVRSQLADAKQTDLILLPELFAYRGSALGMKRMAEPVEGGVATGFLQLLAGEHRAWVLGGGLMEAEEGRIYNTSVLVDPAGVVRAAYRKMHLFEARLDTGEFIRESDVYHAGDQPVLVDIEGWSCGLSICYDLRFPELFRHYAAQGADLLLVPSNFTLRTGRDHWEVLARARAIENQCYVAAPNQCDANPVTGIASYGGSLVADPWGEVLAEAQKEPTVLTATLSKERLQEVRGRIPVLEHRRL